MLKVKALIDGQPTMLLGLSTLNQQRLLAGRPLVVMGDKMSLPQMRVILLAGRTHQALLGQLRTELNMPHDIPQYGAVGSEANDRPLRISSRIGADRLPCLMLGFSAANLTLLAAGAIFHIDGRACQVPEVKLCVAGLDMEANEMTSGDVAVLVHRCMTSGIRL